jgi:hypothetical protein
LRHGALLLDERAVPPALPESAEHTPMATGESRRAGDRHRRSDFAGQRLASQFDRFGTGS